MKKYTFTFLVILAIVIRLFLMMFTFHSDLVGQILSAYFFAYRHIINIYDYLGHIPSTNNLVSNIGVSDVFIYPPLTFFTLGGFLKLVQPFIGEVFYKNLINGMPIYTQSFFPQYLFLLKLPYFLVDILLALVLTKLFDTDTDKRRVFLLWLFNPVTLYTTAAMGVFDIIPTLFTVLALVFTKRKRLVIAAVMLGIGAAYKSYPLFLIPILVMVAKGFWPKVKVGLAGIAPFVLSIAPFWSSSAFKYMVFGPKSQKEFFMIWLVSGAEGIYPYILGFVILCLFINRRKNSLNYLYQYFLAFFLLLFGVTNYHPQWFIWITPFLVIELVVNKFRNLWLVIGLFLCYLFIVLTFENSLSIGLFAPLNHAFADFPGVAKIIMAKTDLNFLRGATRSVFAGISLYLVYDLFKDKNKIKNRL